MLPVPLNELIRQEELLLTILECFKDKFFVVSEEEKAFTSACASKEIVYGLVVVSWTERAKEEALWKSTGLANLLEGVREVFCDSDIFWIHVVDDQVLVIVFELCA